MKNNVKCQNPNVKSLPFLMLNLPDLRSFKASALKRWI